MKEENFAFIDGQNLNLAVQYQGWKLDWRKFREYLSVKFHITEAYYFVGYIPENKAMYDFLIKCGYVLVFKPTTKAGDIIKGNVDVDLTVSALTRIPDYHQAVIVSGDGDFHSLIQYLESVGKLKAVLIPDYNKFSGVLHSFHDYLYFLNHARENVEYKKSP